jgi:predicted Zn-dependent protease
VAREDGLEAFGLWTAAEVRLGVASTAGVRAADAVTDAFVKVVLRDDDGRSGYATGAAVATGGLDVEDTARRSAATVPRGRPAEVAPGELPVVLGPDAVAELLEFLAVLAFNGLAHAEGRGALAGRLGTRVAAPCVSLSDSPRYAGSLPRAFDAEGVPKAPLPLVQDGIAHAVVHDTRSAARAGAGRALDRPRARAGRRARRARDRRTSCSRRRRGRPRRARRPDRARACSSTACGTRTPSSRRRRC